MGNFNIIVSQASFYVIKRNVTNSGGSLIYEYDIYSTQGDNIQISLSGDFIKPEFYQNGVFSVFSDGIYSFNNSMKIIFKISRATQVGEYKSALLTVTNNDISPPAYNEYSDSVENQNDEGIITGIEGITGDGVNNTDPNNPVISFPKSVDVDFVPSADILSSNSQEAIEEVYSTLIGLVSSINGDTKTISSNYTVLISDRNVNVNAIGGDITITLPAVTDVDSIGVTIKKVDPSANIVTLMPNSSELIDGNVSDSLDEPMRSKTIYSDGINYWNK